MNLEGNHIKSEEIRSCQKQTVSQSYQFIIRILRCLES